MFGVNNQAVNLVDAVSYPAHTDENFLSLYGITHRYGPNQACVLDDLTLSFKRGEVTVVLGSSGSGKSTLLQIISGLLAPTRGTVLVAGNEYNAATPHSVLLYQEPLLFPWLTVSQNVGLALRYARIAPFTAQQKVGELLALTGLTEIADSKPRKISGGQQQRAAFARAIAANPKILLLDEPFSNLDPLIRQHLQYEVRSIVRRLRLTVVMVTHDLDEAIVMGDRIILLGNKTGRIESDLALSSDDTRHPGTLPFNAFKRELEKHFKESDLSPHSQSSRASLELMQ